MLIVPVHKKITAKNFPTITFLLVLANCLVFFLLQTDDEQVFEEAIDYYFESRLPDIELPRYRQYLKDTGDSPSIPFPVQEGHEETGDYDWLIYMESDPEFMLALESGEIVTPKEPIYGRWKLLRKRFERILDSSFTQRFLLRYNEVDPVTAFTHMFMHGGFGHLLGNMLFLVFLGILVEGALGRGLFLATYLIAGLAAAAASLLVHWGSPSGGLGASGAIAGLMGLYTVLYGRRNVRFFYWFFVFFDYVKKPAIILLPFWLGWELLQYFFGGYGVAYEAHIGGILAGAVMGYLIVRLGWENRDFLDEETKREGARDLFAEAMDDLKEFRVDAAREKLKQLLPEHGQDLELLQRYYNTCKLQPGRDDFHDAARRILLLPGNREGQSTLVRDIFRDYIQTARGKVRLAPQERKELAVRLANWGFLQEARVLADALLKQANPNQENAEAILALGRACTVQGKTGTARHYLMQTVEHFPDSPESPVAQQMLRNL